MKKLLQWIGAIYICFFCITKVNATTEFYDDANAKTVTVLNYHHFGEEYEYPQIDNIRVSGESFLHHLQAMKNHGYETISQQQLYHYIKGIGQIPEKSVLITIDDGFESVYTIAYPILKAMNMSAVVFPITMDMINGERKGVPMMNFAQLTEVVQSGVMEVGNHTHNLHWRGINGSRGPEAMISGFSSEGRILNRKARYDLIKSDSDIAEQRILSATGVKIDTISYPFGAYDETVLQIFHDKNYKLGYTTKNGLNLFASGIDNSLEINRMNISKHLTADQLIQALQNNIQLADQHIQENKDIVVSTKFVHKQLHVTVSSRQDRQNNMNSIKDIHAEIYITTPTGRTYIGDAQTPTLTPTDWNSSIKFIEQFTNESIYAKYGNGDYYMKITMNRIDDSSEVEWIPFKVSM